MTVDPAQPSLVVIAGPNGAGKSSSAPALLPDTLAIGDFVNADVLAQGLAAFDPDQVAATAGRLMLRRLDALAEARRRFAFETTLASRSFAPWIEGLVADGYRFDLVFLWLQSAELSCARVRGRVAAGGHDIPDATIRRRYERGLHNLLRLYIPIATTWQVYDNSLSQGATCVARGGAGVETQVFEPESWRRIESHG